MNSETHAIYVGQTQRELAILKATYGQTLDMLQQRLNETREKLGRGRVTNHDAFNMSATLQDLAVLAGKIEAVTGILAMLEAK